MNIRHIDDLKSDKTPLSVVPGVGDATAQKLKNGGITSVMLLSLCNPLKLVALGVQQSNAKAIVKAAEELIVKFSSAVIPVKTELPVKDKPKTQVATVMLNGRRIQITKEDYDDANAVGKGIEEWMHLDPDTKSMELRIAKSRIATHDPNTEVEDYTVYDFDFDESDPMEAPDFIKKRRSSEIDTQHKAQINRHKTFEETASFVQNTVHGENIDGMGLIKPEVIDMNPTQEQLDTEVYIPNRRHNETQLEAQKAQKDSVQKVIDELL